MKQQYADIYIYIYIYIGASAQCIAHLKANQQALHDIHATSLPFNLCIYY